MFKYGFAQWLRSVADDVRRVLMFAFRPWLDLTAVKRTQVAVVDAVADQQAEIADAVASIRRLESEVERLREQSAEQQATIRRLSGEIDALRQAPDRRSRAETDAS